MLTAARSPPRTSTRWRSRVCVSRSSTTRRGAGPRAAPCSPATTPSRSTATPSRVSAVAPKGVRQSWARLVPEFLRTAGYRNYHSGKWHIDGKILPTGFDRSLNMQNPGQLLHRPRQLDRRPAGEGPRGREGLLRHDRHDRPCAGLPEGPRRQPLRQALLPLPGLHRPALPAPRLTRGHRQVSRPLPRRLGGDARRPLRPPAVDGPDQDDALAAGTRGRPALRLPDGHRETRPGRGQPSAALGRTDAGAAPLPGHEDGHPRRDGRPHGPGHRPRRRPAQGDGRLREHAHPLRLR